MNKEAIFDKSFSNKTTSRKSSTKCDIKLLKNDK